MQGCRSRGRAAPLNFFRFVLEPWFVWSYCAIIAGCFAWFLRRLILQTGRLTKTLRDLRERLPQREDTASPDEVRARFARGFEDYSDNAADVIGIPWHEFVERLILPGPQSSEPIRNTREVSYDLNDETIVFPQIEGGIFRSIPNLLTGMGILGTFLGLAVGVGVANEGLTSTDQERITAALRELLSGAALAFVTSVVGILLSLVFLVIQRHRSRRCHLALSNWVTALEDCLLRITSEDLARQTLEQARTSADELKTFNTELIFSIQTALEERVGSPLADRMDRLLESLDGLRRDRATDNATVIKDALQQFESALSTQTATAFEGLATTVERLDETLKASTEAHEQSGQRVEQTLGAVLEAAHDSHAASAAAMTATVEQAQRGLAESLEESLRQFQHSIERVEGSMTDSMRKGGADLRDAVTAASGDFVLALSAASTESAEKITAAFGKLESAAATLEAATCQNAALLPQLNGFVGRFGEVRQALRATHEEIVACAVPVRTAAVELRKSSDTLTTALHGTHGLVARVEESAVQMRRQGESVSQSWARYETRFEGLDASLVAVFDRMSDGLASYTKQVAEFAEELDRTTADAISKLAAATSELNQAVEDLLEGLSGRS